MRPRALMLVVGLVLLVSACGGDDASTDAEVRPFEEIQASEITFENDLTFPGRGILRVTTTEPAICAIVWGETEDLGRFNNSLDMNGTGIIQHDVVLPDAEPGTSYFYRLQGSTADGTLFQSELMTFELPETEAASSADAEFDRSANLAVGATVTAVSSQFSDSWAGANAIDGDLATEWATSGDGDAAFIEIDLGSPRVVTGFEFLTRSMTDGSSITTTFTVSVDGGDPLGPFDAGNPAAPVINDADVSGQVFRFAVAGSTGGNTGAIEIGIYGP
jgi:hypothetical protein